MGIVLDPTKRFPTHPSEEILEELVFHRLPEALTAQVEEHLLICEVCQDALAETDRFVLAMQDAARHQDAKQPAPDTSPVPSGWHTARTSLAPIALALLALVIWRQYPRDTSAPVAVTLSSLRSEDSLAPAPAGKPLQLNIEAPDFSPGNDYKVEVVDASGRQVWKGGVTEKDGKIVAQMSKPPKTGVYWVRVYGAGSELLREFGMSVK